MSVDADALTTLAKVQAHLGIAAGTDESLLETLINQATDLCEKYTGRKFYTASYTEYYDGDGTDELLLAHYPIISVTHLYVDESRAYPASSEYTENTHFLVYKEEGRLSLLTVARFNRTDLATFPSEKKCIKVEYVAGYAAIPGDLEWACNELVGHLYNSRGSTSVVQSQSIGGFSETYADASAVAIPAPVRNILDAYVNHVISPTGTYTT
jgi:uncharacterized phiE125 gp8 family phage protein